MAERPARTSRAGKSGRSGGRGGGEAGGRGGGGGIPWLGLGILALIAVAVLAARTMGFSRGEQARSIEPTLTAVSKVVTPTAAPGGRAPQPVAQPRPTPGPPTAAAPTAAAPTPPPPTAVRAGATPTARAPAVTPAAGGAASPTSAAAHVTSVATVSVEAAAGSVALTFDAGADRGYAEDILDILQTERVVASFGITGQWAKANPELVRRMAADGHMVFNHTLDHHSFTGVSDQRGGLSAARRRAELEDADAIIAPLLGHSTQPWYRLPYGDDDAHVTADLQPSGYTRKVGWSVDSLGWRGLQASDIVARCLNLAAPNAVYVLHVGRASQDGIALVQIIHGLRDKGFSFHRIDQT